MAEYDAGEAFLRITPNLAGIIDTITREAEKWGLAAGQAFSRTFNDTVRRGTNGAPLGPSDTDSARQGDRSAGKFSEAFRSRLAAAMRALPDIQLNANSSDADRKLASLRAQLDALRTKRIGVDIDEGAALAQLDALRAQLDEVARSSPSASVRVNTAAARAELDRLRADLDTTDAKIAETKAAADSVSGDHHIGISADGDAALAVIEKIRTALLALSAGAVITPLIGGAAGLLAPLAAGVLGGIGVGAASLPGLSAIKNVLSGESQAQKSAGAAAQTSGQQQASAAAQVESAELSLQQTRARIAANRITQAQQVAQAEHGVTTAEQQLTAAEQASLNATQQLTDARLAAKRGLQDSAFSVTDARLQLQQDQLALQLAQAANDAAQASTTATPQQKQQAALALAEAQQSLLEQQVTLTRAEQDNTTVQKQGIAQSPQVVAAQQQQAQAAQQVATAQYGLAQAHQGVANARRQAAQQASADAITLRQAELSLANAQRQSATAAAGATSATLNLAAARAKLTGPERDLLTQVEKTKKAFTSFGRDLEPVTLPLFGDMLAGIRKLLPIIEPLVRAVASAFDDVVKSVNRAIGGAGFQKFLHTLTGIAGPSIHGFATLLGNLAGVAAHVIEALAPLGLVVLRGLDALSGALSHAAASPALKQFGRTLSSLGPLVIGVFKNIGSVIGTVFHDLAPLAGPVLQIIKTLTRTLDQVLRQIGPALSELFTELAPVVDTVIKALGPAITAVLKALGPALVSLTPGLTALGKALAEGLAAAAPALQPLARLISAIVVALSPFLPLLGRLIGAILPPLARLFTEIANALSPVVDQLVQSLTPVIPVLADSFSQLVTALTPMLPMIGQLLIQLIPLIPPMLKLTASLMVLAAKALPLVTDALNFLMPILDAVLGAEIRFVTRILNTLILVIQRVGGWLGHLGEYANAAAGVVSSAWTSCWDAVRHAWNDVSDFLTSAWHDFTGTAKNAWQDISDAVTGVFDGVADALKDTWHDVEQVFADGVNFITQDILNPLVRILNDVLSVFGVKIPTIPKLTISAPSVGGNKAPEHGTATGRTRAFATGGVLPGYTPGHDGIRLPMFAFSGGEGILVPEATRALGGETGIRAINAMFSPRVSAPGAFLGGGIIGDIGGALGSIGSGIGHLADSAAGIISSGVAKAKDLIRRGAADAAVAALKSAESPIRALAGEAPAPLFTSLINGFFDKVDRDAYQFIRGNIAKVADTASGPIPTGQHLALIRQALGIAHVPDTAGNEAAVNMIVSHESGWDAKAINNWDSNAQAGDPSRGLMQTIATTFEAYRSTTLPDNIYDPLANLVAGIRYAVSRYGSLSHVPGVAAVDSGGSYVGYDAGGFLPPGLTTVYNGTGRPEPVFTAEQWNDLRAANRGMRFEQHNHLYQLPSADAAALAVVRRVRQPGFGLS